MGNEKISGGTKGSHWNAVLAMSLAVSGLIISEFLPVSLLTPIAHELRIAEGVAGQTISVTAIVAMVASLLTPAATNNYNRRSMLVLLGLLQVIANVMVGYAQSYTMLLGGRILLGIGLGGFWSLCVATIMRLIPEKALPKALAIVFGAVSLATVIAAPLSSFLGHIIGWRKVFLSTAGLGIIALFWQAAAVPPIARQNATALITLVRVMKRPGIKMGMLGVSLVFTGYGIFFTYLRPFLETFTKISDGTLSVVLLGFSLANLAGSTLGRFPLEKNIFRTIFSASLLLGIIVCLTVVFRNEHLVVYCLVALWGLFFGVLQIGWNMWITRVVPDEAESGGGLLVAVIQFGIMSGAAAGGYFYDTFGGQVNYLLGSVVAVGAAACSLIAFKQQGKPQPKG